MCGFAQSVPINLSSKLGLPKTKPIITIDGPAGAGKSTVARQVAQRLGLFYLDTGAMYRALTWLVLDAGIAPTDRNAIAELADQCQIEFLPDRDKLLPRRVLINNQDVTQFIRLSSVTDRVAEIAAQPNVRQALVKRQQAYRLDGGLIAEGRDMGTHVFPSADLKIFLTASVQERAHRRQQEMIEQGISSTDLQTLERSIIRRDQEDMSREVSPLHRAIDAIEIQTDTLSLLDVSQKIINLYLERLEKLVTSPAIQRERNDSFL